MTRNGEQSSSRVYVCCGEYVYVLCCTVLCCTVPCRAAAAAAAAAAAVCRVVSCRVVSCRVVSCRVVSCRVVSCRVVSCRVVSCRVVSCRVVSCRVVSCRAVVACLWLCAELSSVCCWLCVCCVVKKTTSHVYDGSKTKNDICYRTQISPHEIHLQNVLKIFKKYIRIKNYGSCGCN